jgi:hypothetical protein
MSNETTKQQPSPVPVPVLSPEQQAAMNFAVTRAVTDVFAQIAPLLKDMAFSPEKIAEAEKLRRAPDPALVQRELRERQLQKAENDENERNKKRRQENCPHRYPTGGISVNPVNNYPDRQPRLLCMLCQGFFQPRRWEIGAPDKDNPRGRPFIAEAHPKYAELLREVSAASPNKL